MDIKKELTQMIKNMKKGETINYWEIADRFDKIKKNGEIDYRIVDKYDAILDDLEEKKIIKIKKDSDGNDNIIVKR